MHPRCWSLGAPVVALCLLTVAACGGSDDPAADSTTAVVTTTTTSEPSTSDRPTTTASEATTTSSEPATTTGAPTTTSRPPHVSELYQDPASWICRADTEDLCDTEQPVTEVAADGSLSARPAPPAVDPPVDCFYVYPTTSDDASIRSDMIPGSEVGVVRMQAAPFNQVCTVYAPLYRSVTLAGLFGGDAEASDWLGAYADVLDAWRHYLDHDNAGRPVILLGHSQGSIHLTRLLGEEIEEDPAQLALLVSAMLIGTNFEVPTGADVGGATDKVPLCRDAAQIGCVITYASFSATDPPGVDAFFGRPFPFPLGSGEGQMSGCTNPAALGGGPAPLDSVFPTAPWALGGPRDDDGITTPFMALPGLFTGECVAHDGFSYLAISVDTDSADLRSDVVPGGLGGGWGLHAADVPFAQGSLIGLARRQIGAFTAAG